MVSVKDVYEKEELDEFEDHVYSSIIMGMERFIFEELTYDNIQRVMNTLYSNIKNDVFGIKDCIIYPDLPVSEMTNEVQPSFEICISSMYGKYKLQSRYDKQNGIVVQTKWNEE